MPSSLILLIITFSATISRFSAIVSKIWPKQLFRPDHSTVYGGVHPLPPTAFPAEACPSVNLSSVYCTSPCCPNNYAKFIANAAERCDAMHGCRYALAFLVYGGSNVALVCFSALLVVYISPAAAGSGIPEVKAFLNGVDTPNIFSLKTFFVKVSTNNFRQALCRLALFW